LISWRLTKDEIEHIDREKKTDWPKVIVEAPRDGTIVEKNVVTGELVDPTLNLFVIADLSRLSVWASCLEGDLLKLHPGQDWTVALEAVPGRQFKGKIDVVGAVFDPTQHTVTVQGTIENKLPGTASQLIQPLRAGMYATATVRVPPDNSEVVVPTTALIDDGEHTYVYVQSAKTPTLFERRDVVVHERRADQALLRRGVIAGEKVVTRGCPELDQKAQATD
jgi:RND family efflux transporter MFP subunit